MAQRAADLVEESRPLAMDGVSGTGMGGARKLNHIARHIGGLGGIERSDIFGDFVEQTRLGLIPFGEE